MFNWLKNWWERNMAVRAEQARLTHLGVLWDAALCDGELDFLYSRDTAEPMDRLWDYLVLACRSEPKPVKEIMSDAEGMTLKARFLAVTMLKRLYHVQIPQAGQAESAG